MKKLMTIFLTMWFILSPFSVVYGVWQGPIEVVSGIWGNELGQFGIEHGDNIDQFPHSFGISNSEKIVIADFISEVLHIFNNNGTFLRDIKRPIQRRGWPSSVKVGNECAVVSYTDITHTFDIPSGDLVGSANIGVSYVSSDCTKLYSYTGEKTWKVYSPTGQLLQTYASRPLELGVIKELKLAPGQYKVTVKYPDKEWVTIGKGACPQYVRDTNGNLYCVGDIGVIRYDDKGNEIASLMMPKKKIEEIPAKDPGVEPMIKVIEEYGSPVVAPNGDVYTWKRTPDKYYVIKWTWQP